MNEGTCKHYNGLQSGRCEKGVDYRETFGRADGIMLRLPCIQFYVRPCAGRGTYVRAGEPTMRKEVDRRDQQEISCPHLELPTAEEVAADRAALDEQMRKTMLALQAVYAWRVRQRPQQDRREVVECPVCRGRLHLSKSAYNGHVHGRCETEGCVAWME